MAVKTKDVVVDYNQLGNPGLTVDANGKNAIRIDNLPNSYNLQNGKLKENGTLVFEDITNSKTLIIENPETIRYIKTHYQKVGKKETYQLVDIYENDFVLNEKTITEYDAKLTASGTNFKDNMDFSSYAPSESTTKGLTINGGNGSDTIKATNYNDVIKGGTGNDSIEGLQGDDTIYGDAGNDFIRGGDGNDVIYGGNDVINNDADGDDIMGGKGNDTITGGSGRTHIGHTRGDGDDVIYLTKGENLNLNLDRGNEGSSYGLLTKSEVSYKYSDDKKDLIIYSDKNDASKGSITLKNFATKDILNNATKKTPDTSSIKIHLSDGVVDLKDATFEDMSVKTTDIKSNFTGTWLNDDIDASEYQLYDKKGVEINDSSKKGLTIDSGAGNDKIIGTNYSDTLKGGNGNDEIRGGKGNDKIYGGDGINKLYGDDGNDLIQGGKDVNIIYGGSGNDTIYGGNEYNESYGGEGNDVIKGGNGSDFIYGGKGNDTITGGKGNNEIVFAKGDGHDVINLTKNEELIISLYENDYDPETHSGTFVDSSTIKYEYSDNKKDLIIYFDEEKTQGSLTLKNYVQNNVTKDAVLYLGQDESGNDIFVDLKKDIEILTKPESNFTGTWLDDDIDASGYTLYKDKAKLQIDDNYARKGLTLDGGNGNDKIIGTNYSDTLKGGNGNDFIEGGSGNDIVYGGNDKDAIKGGDGNDTIYGDNGDDIIDGQSGDDVIYGGNGDDTITGSAGNDTITGGAGKNTLVYTAGDGNDTVYLTKGEDLKIDFKSVSGMSDFIYKYADNHRDLEIYDKWHQQEKIVIKDYFVKDITNSIMFDTQYTKDASLKLQQIVTEIWDDEVDIVNGTWVNDVIRFATYSKGAIIKAGDGENHVTATCYDDKIYGGKDIDHLIGEDGNDLLYGYAGHDVLTGGDGNDTIYGDDGEDSIRGGGDNDKIYGGDDNDTINGDGGNDLIYGGNGNDKIEGGADDDTIYGDNGDDIIDGQSGDDVIYGGNGDDNITGGMGNDTITGGAGTNTINYTKGNGNDVINLTKGENFNLKISGTTFDDLSFVISSDGKDLLIYTDDTKSEYITIKNFIAKNITKSAKMIIGDVEYDLNEVSVESVVDKNFAGTRFDDNINASATVLFKELDKTSYIEKYISDAGLTLNGGVGDDTVVGTNYSDVIKGGVGDDDLRGGNGFDTLYGENGNDNIFGDDCDDEIYGGNGNDVIDGGEGDDEIDGGNDDDIIYGGLGDDEILGGNGNDKIDGGEDDDYINGGNGDDTIKGGTGNDTIIGGAGRNTLEYTVGDGNDVIYLTKGENFKLVISGSGITDINDLSFMRDDNDLLIYTDNSNDEEFIRIKDFAKKDVTNNATKKTPDTSSVMLEINGVEYDLRTEKHLACTTLANGNYTGTYLREEIDASGLTLFKKVGNSIVEKDFKDSGLTLNGVAGDDTIKGSKYSDILNCGNGDDSIEGGTGNDTITGGAGKNTIVYRHGDGNDVVNITKGEDLIIALPNVNNFNDIIFEIAPNGKDLRIKANNDNRDEFMTIKDYVSKDILNSGKFLLGDSGQYEHDFSEMVITVNTTKNYTGTRLKEKIDASGATKGVTVNSGAGNDTVYGSDYNDVIKGTSGDKKFSGGKGNDTIYGTNGYNNDLHGGEDDDKIYAGNLSDSIYGDAGNDFIKAGDGDDSIWGDTLAASESDGNDTIYGEGGNDKIFGEGGDDYIDGGLGDDSIKGGTGDDTIYGGLGDDSIKGGTGDDTIYGGDGNDTIEGEDGNNYLDGGNGNDTIYGGDGNSTIYGGKGKDTIYGGFGSETIDGGDDNDFIKASAGNDLIYGGNGDDEIWGEGYNDIIYGGNGDDIIYGGDGSDLIYGDAGDDSLSGGNSDDTIYGGVGNDIIEGYKGDDYIEGGKGNDTITGGEGANYIVYNKGDGDDFITLTKGEQFKLELKDVRSIDDVEFAIAENGKDFIIYVDKNKHATGSITLKDFAISDVTNNATETSQDTSYVKLVINGTEYDLRRKDVTVTDDYIGSCIHENIDASSATKGLNINGMDGRDTINGSNYNDTIYGGAGNDSIKGNAGNNTLYGDDGNDTIYGGTGNDSIEGGAGDDKLYGGSGSCTIHGNTGNDTIWASSANSTIYGDEGNDELHGGQGNDVVYGGVGDDYINGNQGNDTLYGGAGNDTLDGGYNSDTLYGGEGNDTYKVYFEKNAMNSVIVDESGTNDVVRFTEWPTGLSTCTKNQLHVVFNVSRDFNKSTDTISWVNILDDTNFTSWKLNPFGDFDGVKIKDNAIENIYSSDNYNLTSADISSLAESVASWLTSNDYLDVNDVLTNEKQVGDIDDLMVILDGSMWRYQS